MMAKAPVSNDGPVSYNPTTGLSYNPNAKVPVTPTPAPTTTPSVSYNPLTGLSYNPNAQVAPAAPQGPTLASTVTGTATSTATSATKPTSNLPTVTQPITDTSAIDALKQQQQQDRVSAFNILKEQFTQYGLGSLVDNIKGLLQDGTPASEFALRLQQTPEYQKRFAANADRIKAGLSALTPAQYVAMEDQYQNLMRNYGLPASYYAKDDMGTQAGFQKLLANDVSASELEDRIATAQQRVLNTNPEVLKAFKQFYPDINNADILAYTLDPQNALSTIHRKVSAAEIGGAALAQGLQANGGTAESLAGQGITKAQAQQGYTNVAEMVPRGSQLADIYGQTPYTQGTAEAEVFNTAGAADAAAKRKKLTSLETAQFSGSSGVGSLNRDRPVSNYMLGQPGAGSY
jgi:hypothetical protein